MRKSLNLGTKLASAMLVLALMATSASAQFTLTVSFAGGNGSAGNMFDMSCSAPLIIDSFDIHQNSTTTVTDYEVYYRTARTSYVGHNTDATGWTLLGSATGITGAGAGLPTPLNLNLGFVMNPGETIGFYVTSIGPSVAYTNGTAVGNVWASDSFLTVFEGHGGSYPFNNTNVPRNFNGQVHYTVLTGNTDDLACASVDGPGDAVGCATLGNEGVTFTVNNFGSNTILSGANFAADLTVGGSLVATENFTLTSDLAQFSTAQFTFAALGDFSAGGMINADVTVYYAGDLDNSNDSASRIVNATGPGAAGGVISSFPFTEDFDAFVGQTTMNGFIQDPNDSSGSNGNWYFNSSTPSGSSGPETNGLGDHTSGSGKFAYIEDSSTANPIINLLTPCLDLTGTSNPHVRVWVNAHDYSGGTEFNAVDIDLLTSGGVVPSIGGVYSDTGDAWQQVLVDLSAYIGQVIQVQFRSTNTNSSFHCDSAIDDVAIVELATQVGQPPQAGIASLDINSAVNGNGAAATPGTGGPFFASATVGGSLAMTFSGEPNNGILFLTGPLNPVTATFPGFGQMDIGTLPLNGLGIPGGLFIWADGVTAPVMGINSLFNTGPAGTNNFSFPTPNVAPGVLAAFQCVMTHSTLIAGISNAVEVTVN